MAGSPAPNLSVTHGEGAAVPTTTALLCRARTRLCALPIAHVVETMRPLPVAPLAGAPPFVCGLALIRGRAVPVVDVGMLLGAAEPPAFARLVTVRTGARRVGLAFEAVVGCRELPLEAMAELPPLLSEAGEGAIAAVATLDADLLLILKVARLVPDSTWTLLQAADSE